MYKTINGIQHIGVGVPNHAESWKWYRQNFGMDICFFNGAAEAPLMQVYTRGKVINKQAAMISNLHGGCAMEVVSPISFTAKKSVVEFEIGDLGIFSASVKAPNLKKAFDSFSSNGTPVLGGIESSPIGRDSFYIKDPNGLLFQITQGKSWFVKPKKVVMGGPTGVTIGVRDMKRSLALYADILGYDKVMMDETGVFNDWKHIPGGFKTCRRVMLTQSNKPGGGFANLTGQSYIELVQALNYEPKKIFKGRIWGDVGFVHLGFDVRGMNALGVELASKGFGFTCDTDDVLTMGSSTRVHCTYIEDPDGTLIELIEVFKIPIIERLGIYLNVEKRDPKTPLP
ncbi:MAG: catechol 2,3-dioxygenase-like lactoylglutathione lyase family enzyme, partial [Salibacteraceae bacterium]